MRLVFAGTPEVALPSLSALVGAGHEVVAVLTRPDAARGRSRRLVPSPVAAWAQAHGLPVLKPPTLRDPAVVDELRALAPDACPVVAYGALVPPEALAVPRFGWVNLHFSLLPRWRGAAPVQRAIMAGDEVTGATTFRLVRELDAGPVFASLIEPLAGHDTAGDVLARLAVEGAELLRDTVDALPNAVPVEQDPTDGVTLAPKIEVAEARLNWSQDGIVLDRLIRGCAPEPMAWTEHAGERFRIALAKPLETASLAPGRLRVERRRVVVGTGGVDLELLRVQPQGRHVMPAADWGRGLRDDTVGFA